MKISEIKGERALDLLADMLEPFTEILADESLKDLVMHGTKIDVIKKVLKDHKKSVITILALTEDEDPETYEPTITEVPVKIMQILNDPVFRPFFTSQGQVKDKPYSGSATENTGA